MTDPFGRFVSGFVSKLRADADNLNSYGAAESAQACVKIATDLEADFQAWWLAELPVSVAASECGYSADRLREMCRDNEIPHQKGTGANGHLRIARCNLPRKVKRSGDMASLDTKREARDAKLLGKGAETVLRSAS